MMKLIRHSSIGRAAEDIEVIRHGSFLTGLFAWIDQCQRAACAFLILLDRALFCAGVGFSASGTFGLGLALKRSPRTCTGTDPN